MAHNPALTLLWPGPDHDWQSWRNLALAGLDWPSSDLALLAKPLLWPVLTTLLDLICSD